MADTTTAPAATQQQPTTDSVVATNPEEAKKQVFVGNLAFVTTEADLKSLFAEAGTVAHAQIITRGTRSLGYAFVTFSSEQEAQKAVQTLNKREVSGREINVEGAKPQSATAKANGAAAAGGEDSKRGAGGRGRGTGRGGRGGRGGSTRGGAAGARRPRTDGTAAGAAPTGEPSQTLIFVANLPFSTDDDGLKAAFAKYKIANAFVAKRYGRKSKGYGFVDAESHEEQTKILEESNGLTIEGREVQLRIALNKADTTTTTAAAGEDAAGESAAAPAEATA